MKLKIKITALLLSAVLGLAIFTGCGKNGWPETSELAGLAMKSGIIPQTEATVEYPDTSDTVFRMFFDNTNSMRGFVKPTIENQTKTAFVYSVDDAIDVASSMLKAQTNGFRSMEGYILKADQNNVLRWFNVELNNELQARFCSTEFYTGTDGRPGTLTENGVSVGPLSRLFRTGNIYGEEDKDTPFLSDGLTVIVSDLMEQNFDLDALYEGVENYYKTNSAAATALIGCYSDYKGNMSVPMFSDNGTSETTIYDYEGQAGYYFFIVGPVNLVQEYVDGVQSRFDADNVSYDTVIFRNCADARLAVNALNFEAVPDTMDGVKKLKAYDDDITKVLGSANTTEVSTYSNNVIVADIDGNTSSAMEDTFQISAMADAEEGVTYYIGDASVYSLNYEEGKSEEDTVCEWVPCTGNALDSLNIRAEALSGEKVDYDADGDEVIVIPQGRNVYYVRCSLELKSGAIEDGAGVYAVVVPYNGKKKGKSQEEAFNDLMNRSISTGDFDRALSGLARRENGYQWSSENQQTATASALMRTPKLANLLNSLSNSAYTDKESMNYLTFIFDMSDR